MKELQNLWNLSAAMDFNKDKYKTANKNINRHFHFQASTNTRWKHEVKRMCLNGVNCRETNEVKKKSKNCNMLIDHFLS